MWLFDKFSKKQKDLKKKKSKRRMMLLSTLCPIGGAVVCAAIIIPIMLTKCKGKDGNVDDELLPNMINVSIDTPGIYNVDSSEIIQGFSDDFLAYSTSEETAKQYLIEHCADANIKSEFCMDLSYQKITGERYAFSPLGSRNDNINNILCLFIKLDFSYAQWQWNSSGNSGDFTFGGNNTKSCDFSSVKILDLEGSNFAIDDSNKPRSSDVSTAYSTFADTSFPSLETLDLSGAIFATTNMGYHAGTAFNTFCKNVFTSLKNLNLFGTVFATTNMNCLFDTAFNTFNYASFSKLETLNLSGAVFATSDMKSGVGGLNCTASETFRYANLPSLETLNISNAAFAVETMSERANTDIKTASYTFSDITFQVLKTLDLSGTVFAATNMNRKDILTADHTFYNVTFSSLETLNLSGAVFATTNMTIIGDASTAFYTFNNANFESLEILNFGNCEIQGTGISDNTINSNCFENITKNPTWSSTQLQLSSDGNDTYWNSTEASRLNTWFGPNNWRFNI